MQEKIIHISVVVPLYNKAQSVAKTLQSVLCQTWPHFEVLVVDDGSTDGSAEVVAQFQDERLRLIRKSNGGVSSARNRGIQEAKYEYVAFLDADDLWMPDYLEHQVAMIQDFPEADMWSVAWGEMVGGAKVKKEHYPANYRGYINNYWQMPKKSNIFFVCVCVCRRAALLAVGGYDERIAMGEDLDLAYRMLLHGHVAFNSQYYGMYYVLDAENRAMNRPFPIEKKMLYYFDKYADARKDNPVFCQYIDRVVLGMIQPYLLSGKHKDVTSHILSQTDLRKQSFKMRLAVCAPHLFNLILRVHKLFMKA